MRVQRHAVPMTVLDLRAIGAARKLRGTSTNAARIVDSLVTAAQRREPITVRQRHALYAICWRFRRQIPVRLQVKVTIALAEAKAAAEQFKIDNPPQETVRAFRVPALSAVEGVEGGQAQSKHNPLDDLFPETVSG